MQNDKDKKTICTSPIITRQIVHNKPFVKRRGVIYPSNTYVDDLLIEKGYKKSYQEYGLKIVPWMKKSIPGKQFSTNILCKKLYRKCNVMETIHQLTTIEDLFENISTVIYTSEKDICLLQKETIKYPCPHGYFKKCQVPKCVTLMNQVFHEEFVEDNTETKIYVKCILDHIYNNTSFILEDIIIYDRRLENISPNISNNLLKNILNAINNKNRLIESIYKITYLMIKTLDTNHITYPIYNISYIIWNGTSFEIIDTLISNVLRNLISAKNKELNILENNYLQKIHTLERNINKQSYHNTPVNRKRLSERHNNNIV